MHVTGRYTRGGVWALAAAAALAITAPVAAESVTISYEVSGTPARAAVMKQWGEAFMKLHPDIKVVPVQQQSTEQNFVALAAGSAPDLIISDWNAMVSYAGNGFAVPLDTFISQDRLALDQFYTPVLDGYRYNGSLYELPIKVDTHVMVYNRDLFDQSAVPYPVDWSWDQLRTNSKKLTLDNDGDGTPDRYGFGTYAFWFDGYIGWIWQNGGHAYTRQDGKVKSTYDDPKVESAVQFLVDLMYKDRVMMNPNVMSGDGMFTQDKVASYFIGEWHLSDLVGKGINWDVALIPHNVEHAIELGGIGYLINKESKYPKAAWEFLKFMASDDTVQKSVVESGMGLSALKRMPPLSFPGKRTDSLLMSMNYLRKLDMFPQWAKIDEAVVGPNLSEVWSNQAPVKPTLDLITRQSNAILGW